MVQAGGVSTVGSFCTDGEPYSYAICRVGRFGTDGDPKADDDQDGQEEGKKSPQPTAKWQAPEEA